MIQLLDTDQIISMYHYVWQDNHMLLLLDKICPLRHQVKQKEIQEHAKYQWTSVTLMIRHISTYSYRKKKSNKYLINITEKTHISRLIVITEL